MNMNVEEIVDSIDTEKFIDEIKNKPALWDSNSEEYTHRDLKKKCWDDVIQTFGGKNLSATQRRMMHISLRRKWKGLRGCFTRELRRQENVQAGADPGARKSEYTHFRQMLFLLNVVNPKSAGFEGPSVSTGTVKQENVNCEYYSQLEDDNSEDNSKVDEASSEYSKLEEINIEFDHRDPLRDVKRLKLKKPRPETLSEDEDLLFLLSMLKTLQRVPFKKKMATRIKLMAVLDEAIRDLEE